MACHMKKIDACDVRLLQLNVAHHRDEHAYKKLFLFYHPTLYRFAYSICKNNEAAEEIVSDVMVKIWTMKDDLAAITNLRVYLFKAIRNTAINYLSRNQKYTSIQIDSIATGLDCNLYQPEEAALKKELAQKVLAAVQSLPPKCQMVYKLVREDGFSYREVAAILDISEKTVDRHLNIALHKLVESMKCYFKV
jgi:RNA polymerase sigma-70 factor (ECF subfamily)